MSRVDDALTCFKAGFTCSQTVLTTFSASFGLNRDSALKIAQAFGGGMAHMGNTCGAVTGAFMVIGLKYGRIDIKDDESKERTYHLVREFVKRFESRNSTIICKKLVGYDISTPEGMKKAEEKNIFGTLCPRLVQDSVEILDQIL